MATTLKTNKNDYAPGATVTLTLDGIATGSSYVFAAFDLASDPGDDGVANLYPKFSATDGGWGDLDGLRNGQIVTQWVVPVDPDGTGPQRAPAWNATVQVTATPVVAFGPSGLPTNATSNVVASTTFTDALPAPIQTYFVPLRETNLLTTFDTINAVADSPITTLISIAVAAPGTVIYYDHWEDGYEPDVTNAVQSTTLIWGDGNLLNGIAPGTGGSDIFLGGESIVLSNPVPIPRNAANILFDGADLIKASFPIAVVRAAFPGPGSVGSLLAGGVEVFDTDSWGDDFIAPVGQNTPNLSGTSPFEYTALYVMAGTPNTPVYLDGVFQTTLLNAGDNFVIRVNEDARITTFDPDNATSGRDVQVHLVTGDIGSSYEMRWYALAPRDDWSNDYYTPVGDSVGATKVWLYNPNNASITVRYDFLGGSSPDGSITIAAKSAALSPTVPTGSGARFYSDSNADGVADGANFFALTQTDTGASAGSTGQLFDWGHPLIPASELTSQVVVGLGFGNTTNDSDIASRSVVWVTPVKDATISIDFDGNGIVDATVSATALQSVKIIDNTRTTGNDGTNPPGQVTFPPAFTGADNDQDMSGAIIFATDSDGDPVDIAVAWGQDPARSFSGDGDALDLGTVVIPLPVVEAGKSASLFTDLNSNGKFDPGDTIQYTITVLNFSRVDLPAGGYNVLDYDTPVFDDASYVADSTKYTYNNGATTVAVPDSGATLFPLDEAGFTSTELLPGGESQTFTFLVTIDDYTNLAAGTDTIVNEGVLRVNGQTIDVFDATVPLNFDANIHIEKSTNGIDADSVTGPYITTGSLVTWTYEVTTTAGSVYLADIMVTDDVLGVTPLYQSGDVDDDGILKPGETWVYQATGTAATGQYTNMGTATGTPVYADGTTPIEGATKPTDTDPSHYFGVDGSIQIVKTAGSAADGTVLTTTAGDVLYTYVVSNTGNTDLSDVSVVDDNGTAGVPGDDVTIGTIPSLAIGASVTLTSTFSVTGDRTNIATATGDTPDGGTVSDDDDAVVDVIAPAIHIVKTAGSAADGTVLTTTAGDVLYTYVVSNTGDADLSDVSVVDDNGTAGVPGDDVIIGTIPSLAAGASVTLTSTFSVTGDRTNIATATGDTPDGGTVSDDDDAVVDVIAPAIHIVKTAGSAADGTVLTTTAGDVLYTYVVSNTGDADLSDVSVVDDNGTAGVPGDDVIIGTIPSLAAGASVTLTSTFSVTGDRTNIATATGDTPDGGTVSDDDDAVVDVIAPAIHIVKTAGSAADGTVLTTTAGDVLYTYVVSNTGDADLSDVSVVDDNGTAGVPGDDVIIGTIPSLAAGASVTLTSTFSVTGDRTNIATATGDTPDGGTVSDDDDAVVDVIAPAIHIVKTAGSAADGTVLTTTAGDVLYTYVVSNTGDADLSDVSVVDDNGTAGVPGDDVIIGTIPSLAAGASVTLTSTFSVTGDRTNIATATGDTPDGGTVSDDDDAVVDVIAPAIHIVKTAGSAADGTVLTTTAGDVLYTYVVSNTGDADLSDVSVVDDNGTAGVPGDDVIIGTIPSLAAGASVTLTSTFSVTGDRTNIATATGDTPDGGTVSDDDDAVVDVIAPAIHIVKTAGSAADGTVLTTTAGDVLYTYVVSNTGDADLSDVSVVDDNGTAGVPGDDVIIGTIPSLAAGASVTLTSTFSVTGDRTNIATATGDTPDGGTVSDDDDAVVDVIAPAIHIVKTAGSAADGTVLTTTAGDVLYTYVVSNTGDADLSDVSVVDDNGTAGVPGDDVIIGTIPSLAAGASVTLTSTFSVTGDRTNIATATGDTPDGGTVSDDDDAVVDVIAPAIHIVKTAGSAADGTVLTTTAGDVLYTYVVSNTGDADLSDVSVVDDNGTAGVPGDDVIIGTIPSLAAGASVTLTSTFSVTGDRTNIATATGDTPDGGTVSDDDDAVVDVIAPAIHIVKTAGSAADGTVLTTTAGDVLYTYVVSNTGDADLSDVSVVDDNGTAGVPGDDVIIGTIPSLAAGASVTLTSTFSVTGDRTNIATATGDTPDGGTVSDDDDAVVDVIAPAIHIVKTAGSAADGTVLTTTAGDVLYTYVVSNTGDADLSDVSVVDDNGTAGVPGDDVIIGTIPSLAAGASVTLTSTFSVTGDRTNIATATGDTPDGGTVSDDDDAVVDVIAPAIHIVKTAGSAADGTVLTTTAGDVLYTYVVSNTGDADLSDVSVVDDNGTAGVPGDDVIIGTIPSLAAGASVTLTSTFSVTGDRTNIATATGDTPDGGTVSDDDDAVVDVIAPAIHIVKTAGSAADGTVLTTTAGDVLYTYVVSNTGDADLSDVSVVDDNGTAGVPGDDVIIGTIPSLAAGASVTLTSTFSVTGDRTNIATATGDTPDGGTVSDDDDAVVDVIAPAIHIVKTAGSAADGTVLTTTAGDVLYTYVVSNTGDADLSDVSVVDDNGTAGVPGDDVIIGTIPSLAAGASVTLTSTFSVTGDRTNIATATGDTPDGGTVSDDDDAVVDVIAPAIHIVKTAGSAADGTVLTTTAGDVLYTYVVSNTGDADLSDVSVVDDNGTAGVPGDDVIIGTIPSLAAGASVTLTSTFSVTGDRTNIATATGDTPDGGTVSDDDDAVVDVIAPAIHIVKTAGSAADGTVLTTTAGDVLYTYVVSNTGDADLSDVSVVDDNGTAGVPGDDVIIGTIPSLAAGASVTLTSTFSVTGDRTNIATATGDTPDGGTVSDDDDAVVDVIAPAIHIVKTAGSAADGTVLTTTAGDVLYTYVVSNTGDADLSDVSVVDDNGTAGVPGDDVIIGTIPSLAAGASVTLTSTFSVTGDRTNIATATGDTPDGGTVSDDDDAVVHIEQTGSIGDRVWEDLNYNGIQDPGEPGLANFVVSLLDESGNPTGLSMNTDANGNYLFSNLSAGDYRIQVLAQPGYYYTKPNVGPDALDSDVDSSGVTSIINLSPGESELDWDAGLYRKATLGDKVWLDRDKDGIQDANEAGVGHVAVTLLDAGGGVLATTTTDVFGNYLFSNLDPGTYGLEFNKAAATTGAISVAKYPWTQQNAGGNPNLDSDVKADPGNPNLAFTTAPIVLTSGENDLSQDAGITPIVIDLNGDGIHTISRADSQGVFDLLGTGVGIKSGWLSGDDGFLVIDGNANGRIDDVSEMFGGSQKGDGFAKLASFDSNGDGVVDASDADFASLKVWQDANGNHQTDAGELISLADAGVVSLSLDFTELPFRDAQDNLHLERSSATLSDGAVVDMTDVYLNVSAFDAAAAGVSLPSLGELMSSGNSLDGLWSNPELDWVSQEDQPLETTSADAFGGTPMDYSVDASAAAGLNTLEVQPQFACCDLF